jgi:SAM-dependent methyltransferase
MIKAAGDWRHLFGRADRPAAAAADSAAPVHILDYESVAQRLNVRAAAGQSVTEWLAAAAPTPLLQTLPLGSRAPVLDDIRSPWFAYWSRELDIAVRPHRKIWEYAAVLQAFYEAGVLKPGARALGFGVGDEPLPSYLAGLGLHVLASDEPGQTEPERIFQSRYIGEADFAARVEVSDIDLSRFNDPSLRDFDALWSCGVINEFDAVHIAEEAVIHAMDALRPGGVAVHTTEFAFAPDEPEETAGQLFFPASFFERLADGLNGRGHNVAPLSFGLGEAALDAYVDLEPPGLEQAPKLQTLWRMEHGAPHLKVAAGDALITSFTLIVRRRP